MSKYALGLDLRMATADIHVLKHPWDGMTDGDRAKHMSDALRVTEELVQECERLRFVVLGLKNEIDLLRPRVESGRCHPSQAAKHLTDLSIRIVNALGLDHDDQPLR